MYKYKVIEYNKVEEKDTNSCWGIFPTASIAEIMRAELSKRYDSNKIGFYVKEITKPKLTGIEARFQEDMIDEMDSQY